MSWPFHCSLFRFCGHSRNGALALLLCLATAILQDPLRKLTPDQPVLFVVFVGVVFGAACVGAWARGNPLNLKSVIGRDRRLAIPFSILLLLIIVQAFNSYVRFDNLSMTLIGLATYLLPIPSIALAYQLVFRQGEFRINQFMKWYIVCITLALTTVYLEFSGYDWPVLGQVGQKLIIYDASYRCRIASILRVIPSIRDRSMACGDGGVLCFASDTLAKNNRHAIVDCCDLRRASSRIGLLTGRRKIVMEFAVFVSTYFILWAVLEKRVGKLAIIAVTGAALVGYAWLASELREDVRATKT